MRKWFKQAIVVAAGAALVFSMASPRVAGQVQAAGLPRSSDGHPNLTGLWQAITSAYWDLEDHAARQGPLIALGGAYGVPEGAGVVEGGTIPYRPEMLAKK